MLVPNAVATTAVDVLIPVAVISVFEENVTAFVRVPRSAFWVVALVVTPVGMVTLHSVNALRAAVAADKVSVAVVRPELAFATEKVVLPHPLTVVGFNSFTEPKTKNGSTSAMVSGIVISIGAFNAKMYVIDDFADVTGFAMTSLL